jgi:hypothetical protein
MTFTDAQKLVVRTALEDAVFAARNAETKIAAALKEARTQGFNYTVYSLEDRSYAIRRLASDIAQNLEEFDTSDDDCL